MTSFRDISEDLPVSTKNARDFVNQYDPEIVQGYFMALKDIFGEVEQIAFMQAGHILNPQGTVRRLLLNFYHEKRDLLHRLNELGVFDQNSNDSPKP